MNTYRISIEEMIVDTFTVTAPNAEKAIKIAIEKYKTGEFVLAPGNLVAKQLLINEPENEATEWLKF